MVIHDQVDWRSHQDALALDVSLVESVFYGLSKQYEARQLSQHARKSHRSGSQASTPFTSDYSSPNQLDEMKFAKADVLLVLETADCYLTKRPWLRVLHTRLACVSHELEGASLAGFVRHRQRDRTLCLRDVRQRLQAIYADAQRATELEEQQRQFTAQARAASPWCVRDVRCLSASPARRLYGVHVLPPRRVTPEQLEARRQCVIRHAHAVVNAAVGFVLDKLLAPYVSAEVVGASSRRHERRLAHGELAGASIAVRNSSQHLAAVARARAKRDQAHRDAKLRDLRLEILAPTVEMETLSRSESDGKAETKTNTLLLLLATVEAQGDVVVARQLLTQPTAAAGFRRAVEQAQRLDITHQPWDVVKLWRELYRLPTLQNLRLI